ncbi:diguanylate cyclase domain-containing protein [Candidatus Phycosocius spiralis]|uniref:GGDEF domain-containing protein n=1 Tax=Candidatus Phycosocius spiralis TaxID=2815099 RepID=A0ABQ4PWE1_9PROT|nr:diguanylate cyclase [Candidatus Phycosocius spiralis]GIU67296.1 GGDEF domain-containing protein [Candidatus Phycosocius spiralis]
MAKPNILVLADEDASLALAQAGFAIAGDDMERRQTAAIVIDTRGDHGARAGDLVRSLKSALGPRAGLFMAWSDGSSDFETQAFDGVLDATATPHALSARLGSTLRIAVMADEAKLRFNTLARFGGSALPPVISAKTIPRILLFGQPGPDLLRFSAVLVELGAEHVAAFTSFTAFDYLHDSEFDAVVILAGDDRQLALSFCAAMRRNARMFHLPCLILGSPDFDNPDEAIELGATDYGVAGDNDVAACDRLLTYIDEKRSRDALNLAFAAARSPAAIEASTGLYSSAFFSDHLESLTRRAHETDRPLSVCVAQVAVKAHDDMLISDQAMERLIAQAGSMLARLVRTEDIAARLDGCTFGVAFPSSDMEAATIAATRIAAVLECTAFDVQTDHTGLNHDHPVQVSLSISYASLNLNETASDLLTRAIEGFKT